MTTLISLSMVYCIQKMILSTEIYYIVFIFFVWPLIKLTSFSYCCFREKELHIFLFLLLSCMLYLRCSVSNLLTGRIKCIEKLSEGIFSKTKTGFR